MAQRDMAIKLIEARAGEPFLAAVRKRRAAGQSFHRIGAEFGVSGQTVWRRYKEAIREAAHGAVA